MGHSYSVFDVSPAVYQEIAGKLRAAGYDHAFEQVLGHEVINMHGIGLRAEGHDWQFYENGTFCRRCGTTIGSGQPCR